MATEWQNLQNGSDLQNEEGTLRAFGEIMQSARDIRERLGEKHYLLDNYIKGVLSAIAESVMATETVRQGFEDAFYELRGLCRNIRYEKLEDAEKHPFFPAAKKYLDTHRIPEDSAYYEMCCMGMFSEFATYAVRQFHEKNEARLQTALLENGANEAKEALVAEIGRPAADALHIDIMKCFLVVPQTQIFIQAMLEQVVSSLLVKKDDCEDYIFMSLMNGDLL